MSKLLKDILDDLAKEFEVEMGKKQPKDFKELVEKAKKAAEKSKNQMGSKKLKEKTSNSGTDYKKQKTTQVLEVYGKNSEKVGGKNSGRKINTEEKRRLEELKNRKNRNQAQDFQGYDENQFEGEYKPKKYAPKHKDYSKTDDIVEEEDINLISVETSSQDAGVRKLIRQLHNRQNARDAFVYSVIFERRGKIR